MFAAYPFAAAPFSSGSDLLTASRTESATGADIIVAMFTMAAASDFYRYDIPAAADALRFDVPETGTLGPL